MIRLRIDIAVIGTLGRKDNNVISAEDVRQFSHDLENETGCGIINDFSTKSLNDFFESHTELFQQIDGSNKFELQVNNLRMRYPSIENTTLMLIKYLDPAINYPLELLEQMGILGVITSP